jgi:hypothetical protein
LLLASRNARATPGFLLDLIDRRKVARTARNSLLPQPLPFGRC